MQFFAVFIRRKRYYFLFFCLIVIIAYTHYYNTKQKHIAYIKKCFVPNLANGNDNITLFLDILEADKKPTPDRSIFFIESSCMRSGLAALSARQACAIESAARWNADRDIFVLFPSQVGFSPKLSSDIMNSLKTYRNIYFRRINIQNYCLSTPAEALLTKDRIFESSFLTETLSDILRFVTLYKFGGIYLDTDIIVQQNLDVLPDDFAGAESSRYVANGVLGFSSEGLGHEIAGFIIKDICDEFSPIGPWGHNGPDAISRSLKKICHVSEISEMNPRICWGFTVLSKEFLYPIYWTDWEQFFNPSTLNETLNITRDAVAVHFWNRLSSKVPILKEFKNETIIEAHKQLILQSTNIKNPIGETAYGAMAKANCPLAYNSSSIYF